MMFIPFYEVFYINTTAANTDGTVCNTFEKKWDIREVWINKDHITSLVGSDLPEAADKDLPKDLIKDAGFSRLQVQNGTQSNSVLVVGGPKVALKKLK
tara:strand:+ start:383 stop:676 length:294 start_codon:yes stop_codon:yes gene_type:complete